jgi:hypothetical protein
MRNLYCSTRYSAIRHPLLLRKYKLTADAPSSVAVHLDVTLENTLLES